MNQTQLRQLQNNVEVIGTLKSKELEVKTSMAGKDFMSGKLVVQSTIDNKINEQVIKIFIMESSKLFKGIETVKNEYKTINQDGIENADRIKVKGSLKLNEYYNNQGDLVQFNEVRGMIFNRLDKNDTQQDKAVASIETVVESFVEKLDSDQLPTGEYNVNGFTVGWNSEIIDLKDTFIGKDLVQTFMNLYHPDSTGRLSFKLNSYSEEVQQARTVGFGTTVDIKDTFESTKKYVSNIEIIGGDMPFFNTKEYTPEEIESAKQSRTLKSLELENKNNASINPINNGFGQSSTVPNARTQTKEVMNPNGMPDFD
jgi:hypothetical protein